jgi:hypothetical protein
MSSFTTNPLQSSSEAIEESSDDNKRTAVDNQQQQQVERTMDRTISSAPSPAATTSKRKTHTRRHPHISDPDDHSDDTQGLVGHEQPPHYDSDLTGSYNNISEATTAAMAAHSHQSAVTPYQEDRMRRKLQFFFMNPIEKWKAKRRFPYKFVVQVIKIILVTMQLCLFAHSRYSHINFTYDNQVSFSHLFLRGWESGMEVTSYPPETGPLSVYVKDDFYETINFAATGYSNLSAAIGECSELACVLFFVLGCLCRIAYRFFPCIDEL